ncbi:F-box domain-containing protein [Heracleum sosnowskyi]|uniref:F-box domain-containing protein n=1 Tax=Heracleum sosnowskyi TaxID=360622 RepID=A0AAD8JP63_9APIA|nr:F-box domain-containing protein [Heracleum sosnowskyi]
METRSAKRKKLLDVDNEPGEDRLTELPDAILHYILFLLPIKNIAQTCVLSKRWRHIWYSFPDLDFTTLKQVPHGMDFINHVLSNREKQHCRSDIRVLRLRGSLTCSKLNELIRSAVLAHNVQHLEIDVVTNDCFNLSRWVLKSDSLKILKLKFLKTGIRLPPWCFMKDGFKSLNTLSLSVVIFNEHPNIVMDRLSFPLLEKLSMDKCIGLRHLKVYCQALVKFSLSECSQLDNLEISCPKLEKMSVSRCFNTTSSNSSVMIDAPKLDKIIWNGNAITDRSSLHNLRSLQEASVCFESVTAANLASMFDFFNGLYQLKCLKLEAPCFELLSKNKHFAGVISEAFVNLKSLELHTSKIQELASLFRTYLSLHKLIISITSDSSVRKSNMDRNLSSSSGDEQYWKSRSHAFKPFLHELKSVTIHGISESESEFSLVKFLLGHARGLQEMVISCAAGRGCRRLERIESRVMQFYRASSDAKIVFH